MFKVPGFGSNDFGFEHHAAETVPIKYSPVEDTELVIRSGVENTINTKHQCITAMKEYENKSMEEIRLEDLKAGRYPMTKSPVSWGLWEVKPLPGIVGQPAESKPPSGIFGQPAEDKPLTENLSQPATVKPSFGFFSQSAEAKPPSGLFGQPLEAKPSSVFGQPAEAKLSFGFDQPAETKLSFGFGQPAETKLSFGFGQPAEAKPSFGFGQPAEAKPSFGFGQPAEAKPSFEFGQPAEAKQLTESLGQPAKPKPLAGIFSQPVEANPLFRGFSQSTEAKPLGSSPRRVCSLVYKCYACGLCFDRHVFMSKHFANCVPFKKMTRILCICGLEFDRNNYDYHCEVHRKSTALVKKIVTIDDDEDIDVGGMKEDFMEDGETLKASLIGHAKQETVSAAGHKFNINFVPVGGKHTAKTTDNFAAKVSVVYRCQCRLCFERPDFLFDHLNSCIRGKKTTRILCACGLEFDKRNYDYHCEIHRKYSLLRVKKITIRSDESIRVDGMRQEFAEDVTKAAHCATKDAQVQTDVNEPLLKNSAAEPDFKANGTVEKISGHKIVSAVIDTVESGIDDEDSHTKITIVIAKESKKSVERPNKANPDDYKNNEVTEIRKSETNAGEIAAADNIAKEITAATEGDHEVNDNQVTADIAPNENTAPNKPEHKTISGSDSAKGEAN